MYHIKTTNMYHNNVLSVCNILTLLDHPCVSLCVHRAIWTSNQCDAACIRPFHSHCQLVISTHPPGICVQIFY